VVQLQLFILPVLASWRRASARKRNRGCRGEAGEELTRDKLGVHRSTGVYLQRYVEWSFCGGASLEILPLGKTAKWLRGFFIGDQGPLA